MNRMELKINKRKFEIFLEVAKVLNKQKIIPILFGSLGLNRAIGEFSKATDIDFLVPNELINKNWPNLIESMERLNFDLKDEHEHEFERSGEIVAFAKESDLSDLSKIDPAKLKITEIDSVKFKELSAEQYLICYQRLSRDKYRQEKRGKADQEKIRLIQEYLKTN